MIKKSQQQGAFAVKKQETVFWNVSYAVNRARAAYRESENAAHPLIEAAEEYVNGPNVRIDEIVNAVAARTLKRSVSSGRLYIQLGDR